MSRSHSIKAALVAFAAAAVASCSSSTDDGGNVGPATKIASTSATTQNAVTSQAVTTKPSVKVTDANTFGVGGVTVTFAVTAGAGTLTGATPVTDNAGIATLGSWTTGPTPGINTVTATVTGLTGSPVAFNANASTVISNFTIQLNYLQTPTTAQKAAFDGAAARWSRVITGDLTDVVTNKAFDACGVGDPALSNFIVDDLLIFVSLVGIDGVGKVLGQAGPCFIRTSNKLTVIGIMKFDTADLPNMEANGTLNDVILHEMGHVLGFGSIWDDPTKNFLALPSRLRRSAIRRHRLRPVPARFRRRPATPISAGRSPSPRSTPRTVGAPIAGRRSRWRIPVARGRPTPTGARRSSITS